MSITDKRIDEDYERLRMTLLRNKVQITNKYGETYYLQLFNRLETILNNYNNEITKNGNNYPIPIGSNQAVTDFAYLEIDLNNILHTLNDVSDISAYRKRLKNIEDSYEKNPIKAIDDIKNIVLEFESQLSQFLPINRIALRDEIIGLISKLIETIITNNNNIDLHKFLSELPPIYIEKLIFQKEEKDSIKIETSNDNQVGSFLESIGIKPKEQVDPKKYIEIIDDILFKMGNITHAEFLKSDRIKLEKLLIKVLKLITKLPYIECMNFLNKVTNKYIHTSGKYRIEKDIMIEDQDIGIPFIILKILLMHINIIDEKVITNGLYLYQFGTTHPEFIHPKIFQSDKSVLPKSKNLSLNVHYLLLVARIIDNILEKESLVDITVRKDNRNKPFNKSSYDSIAFSPVNWEKFTKEILNKLYPKLKLLAEIYQRKGTFEKETTIDWSILENIIQKSQPEETKGIVPNNTTTSETTNQINNHVTVEDHLTALRIINKR